MIPQNRGRTADLCVRVAARPTRDNPEHDRSRPPGAGEIAADSAIRLKRGGAILLDPGSVSSFVLKPDHFHMTGLPADRGACLSLHQLKRVRPPPPCRPVRVN
jgi:hypothetical protein